MEIKQEKCFAIYWSTVYRRLNVKIWLKLNRRLNIQKNIENGWIFMFQKYSGTL